MHMLFRASMFIYLKHWCRWRPGRHCVVSLSKNCYINPRLVLVRPRKTRPYITERLLLGRKESNQTNKSWSISTNVWDRAGIKLATPGSEVRHASAAWHVTNCTTRPEVWVQLAVWLRRSLKMLTDGQRRHHPSAQVSWKSRVERITYFLYFLYLVTFVKCEIYVWPISIFWGLYCDKKNLMCE